MTIEQWMNMKTIVEEQSFSQAAEVLHISQSCLSKQIARLEEELGVTLFDRSHHKITLTSAGELCYKHIVHLLEDYTDMMHAISLHKESDSQELHLVTLPSMANQDVRNHIQAFMNQAHQCKLHLLEAEEKDLGKLISQKRFDGFIMRESHECLKHYTPFLMSEDELVCVYHVLYPISKMAGITIEDLQKEELYLMPTHTAITKQLQALMSDNQHETIHYGRLESILAQADMGSGIAIVPKQSLSMFHLQNCKCSSFEPRITCPIYAYIANTSLYQKKRVEHSHFNAISGR